MNSAKKIFLLLIVTSGFSIGQVIQKSEYLHYNSKKLDSLTKHTKLSELRNESKSEEDKFYFKLAEAAVLNSENKIKEAISSYYEAIHIGEELKNDSLKGMGFSRLGLMYMMRDNLPKALINTNEAIKFIPEHKEDSNYVNLRLRKSLIFSFLNQTTEYKKTTEWTLQAAKTQPSKIIEANIYNMAGNYFLAINQPDSAIYYFTKSAEIRERIKSLQWIGQSYNNIGTANFNKGDYNLALKYFQQGLMWRIKGKANFSGIMESYVNIGKSHYKLQNKTLANSYLVRAYTQADSLGNLPIKQRAAIVLKELCIEGGDYKKAMEYQNVYFAINDSMYSIKKKDEVSNMTMDYETDKKLREDSLKRVQAEFEVQFEKEKREAISQRTTIIIILLVLFLGVVIFFTQKLFRSNKLKQKQNELITSQHHLLQEKQTEINDSINYAKNIQNALLPSAELFKETCSSHFIFFRPKDVVSGDFYWASSIKDSKNDLFIYVTADCTGHGVPGAFMSLITISFLNEIIDEEKISDPAEILNKLRKKIIQTLSQKETGHRQDGLDCIVCVLNKRTKELTYSGANNKLYLASAQNPEIREYKGDKMPVGKSPHESIPFTKHSLKLNDNDIIYTFTDGYPDQFGGTQNKKLKTKNVQKKLETIVKMSLTEQKIELERFFNEWKGNNEQIDDVTFIAIMI